MGLETPLCLPKINFSNLTPGTAEWGKVRDRVRAALEEYGCFEAAFDKVPVALRKAIFEASKELYDLPLETKRRNVSRLPFHGYVGQYPRTPPFESMGFDDADVGDKVDALTSVLWPQGNQTFSKTIVSYAKDLSALDKTIRKMILESFGLEKYTEQHMESTNYILMVMRYKAPQTEDTQLGLDPHTDKNLLTIIYQHHEVDGLQIQTKQGQCIDVKLSPDSYIAIVGDSLHAWSNGRLHAPYHRVMMKGDEARYSSGLFTLPKYGYVIRAPEEMVDEEHPLLFKPFDFAGFMDFYYKRSNRPAFDALKAYSGL